jgi:hypothetical protein
MALYNTIFGECPHAQFLLRSVLRIKRRGHLPRYRDCFIDPQSKPNSLSPIRTATPLVVLFTRTGGQNREAYQDRERTAGNLTPQLDSPDGPIAVPAIFNADLVARPDFVCTRDDTLDRTYAWFYFKPAHPIPDHVLNDPQAYRDPSEMWTTLMRRMENPQAHTDDPYVRAAICEGARIVEAMKAQMDSGQRFAVIDT